MTTEDQSVSRILQQTQPWARLMGIMGFFAVGLMILAGLGVGVVGIATQRPEFVMLMVTYPLIAVLYIFPSMYLMRYANRIGEFVEQGQQHQLEAALDAQRAFWKFIGIVTLVSLVGSCVVFVLAIVAGFVAGS
jgi:hypothetical protein